MACSKAITTLLPSIIAAAFLLTYAHTISTAQPAVAQNAPAFDAPIIQRGDAVVTGFSGVSALKPKPGSKLEDYIVIDTQAAALQVYDLSQMFGPDDARLIKAPRLHTVPADQIGQVFGVTLDDGLPATGPATGRDPVPNIYATATSAYGLQIVETRKVGKQSVRERARAGSPQASWMSGQFGQDGGPGSIWKIDGRTGKASLFANVKLDGVANSGPALGAIAFDPKTRRLFVSDLQTGMIHALDLTGREIGRYDHGTQGRVKQGLKPVAFDPKARTPITSPAFKVQIPSTWGFAKRERRVWGLGVYDGRLYYATIEGPDLWSVGITPLGLSNDTRVEVEVFSKSGDPVTAIAFSRDGTMYLSQRGQPVPSYDYKVMATPGTAEVLRYSRRIAKSGKGIWETAPHRYAVGHYPNYRSGNGGVALGYGYSEHGFIRYDQCEGTVWSTGETLRDRGQPVPSLTKGGETIVHGLQGNAIGAFRPANVPPNKAYFLDYDNRFLDPGYRGHMGQVAIWGCSGASPVVAGQTPGTAVAGLPPGTQPGTPRPPGSPGEPDIRIAKSCTAAGLGDKMRCRVTLVNAGSAAPKGPVGFDDAAKVVTGPTGVNTVKIVSATPDHRAWKCNGLPTTTLSCQIDGELLKPGQRRFVDVIMDVSPISRTSRFRVFNCATLSDRSKNACAAGGEGLIVRKKGPKSCKAGADCTFKVSVTNVGTRAFDGDVLLADAVSIPGVPAVDIAWISPSVPGCNPQRLPFQCTSPVNIGPGATRTYDITLRIPANAVPPGGKPIPSRNCFFANDPGLVPASGSRSGGFLKSTQKMLGPKQPLAGRGYRCANFTVTPPDPPTTPPAGKPSLSVSVTPSLKTYTDTDVGKVITYTYTVTNTGKVPITSFGLSDTRATNITCQPSQTGPRFGPLDAAKSMTCTGTYNAISGTDKGKDITSTVTAIGFGLVGAPMSAKADATVTYVKPGTPPGPPVTGKLDLELTVTPDPKTFTDTDVGNTITYTYTVKNKSPVLITTFTLTHNRAKNITCQPAQKGPKFGPVGGGKSITCTGTYKIVSGDKGKHIISTVEVIGTGPARNQAGMRRVATVKYVKPTKPPLTGKPSVSVSVTPSQTTFTDSEIGKTITYTYTVMNTSKVPIISPNLGLQIGGQAELTSCQSVGGDLAAGASATCTGTYKIVPGDIGKNIESTATYLGFNSTNCVGCGQVTKVAYVKPQQPGSGGGSGGGGSGGSGSVPSLTVSVSPGPSTFSSSGQSINYTYTVTNSGKAPLRRINITDNKVTGILCASYGRSLLPGESVICEGTYVTSSADVGRNINSFTTVYGKSAQGKVSPAYTSSVVTFVAKPTLSIVAMPQVFSYSAANQKIVINYTVTNTGSVPLTDVIIKDGRVPVIGCGPNTGARRALAPGEQLNCVGSYLTQASDVGNDIASKVTAIGYAAGNVPAPPAITNTVVKYIPPPAPKLDIVSIDPQVKKYDRAGQNIPYTFMVQNVGNAPVRAFQLLLPPGRGSPLNCAPVPNGGGPLLIGAKTFCRSNYTTTPADVAQGVTKWFIVLKGDAILPGNSIVPVKEVIKKVDLQVNPAGHCPPGDALCARVAQCGILEPKILVKQPKCPPNVSNCDYLNGYWMYEQMFTPTNRRNELYKSWYPGCRGDNAFARSFPSVMTNRNPAMVLLGNPQGAANGAVDNVYRNRACDMFCSDNHAPKNCRIAPPNVMVDEVPPMGSKLSKNNPLWICPWKIDDTFAGVPVVPNPLPPPPSQAGTFCWKKGGSGGCPPGFSNCGLGCQFGGDKDCAIKIVGQVFAAIKAIPLIGDIVGGIGKAVKWIARGGTAATKTVGHMGKVERLKKYLQKYDNYNKAKKAYKKTETPRHGLNVFKGVDRSSSLVNTTIGPTIPRLDGQNYRFLTQRTQGFGEQATTEQIFNRTFHDIMGVGSLAPGGFGAAMGMLDMYGHLTCRCPLDANGKPTCT